MDNKKQSNFSRQANPKACQSAESIRKSNSDLLSNKPWPRQSRRPENTSASKNDQQRSAKQTAAKTRPNVDKRPRQRGGGYSADASSGAASTEDEFVAAACAGLADEDIGAAYAGAHGGLSKNVDFAHGGKKQNLNHLLNFHYASRESEHSLDMHVFGRCGSGSIGIQRGHSGKSKKQKYNKEQFMQANFQFVVKSNAKLKGNSSPDTLIDWSLIEQINIQTTEEPQCPICLYPPIAAKMTRCGHAYCWPCILHYLALSDKSWRKCPICYEAIHTADLKSTTIVQQQPFGVGDQIAFHLMRRAKGSMFIERYNSLGTLSHAFYPPRCSTDDESKLFSKFLIAKRADILNIIEREQKELLFDEDSTCPEFVFIQQALDLLKERREKLGEFEAKELEEESKVNPFIESVGEEEPLFVCEDIPVVNNKEGEFEVADNAIMNNSTVSDSDVTANIPMAEFGGNKCLPTTFSSTKFYYFYQSVDGQNIYLHPLNIKMLLACYGTLDQAPLLINARILQKEHHSMDEDHRRKFTCLGHLPLTCQFAVVEVDLQPPLVTEGILKLFKDDVLLRKKERQRRDREERKRERKINEINDRQMGKLIASTANINLNSDNEFPTCGFEETLTNVYDPIPIRSIDISKAMPNSNVSYSSVTVVGGESSSEFWPTLASPPTTNTYNSYQALSSWGKTPSSAPRQTPSARSNSECGSIEAAAGGLDSDDAEIYSTPMRTNLGDVLAEALSHKKQGSISIEKNYAGNNNKRQKKSKKMQPLFSTGMNYNGK